MNPLTTIKGTITAGVVLAIVIAVIVGLANTGIHFNAPSFMVWLHVLSGITWIGLLYYFNFVQTPALAAAAKPIRAARAARASRSMSRRARCCGSAGAPWPRGSRVRPTSGTRVCSFRHSRCRAARCIIGVGAWLGTIMAINVWVFIWPNQKKVLGLVEATADQIAKARKVAALASRTNTMLSIPMLMSMVAFGHGGFFL